MKIKFFDDNNKEIELDAFISNIEENSKFFYLIQPITRNMDKETMQTHFNWLAKFLKESNIDFVIAPIENLEDEWKIQKLEKNQILENE